MFKQNLLGDKVAIVTGAGTGIGAGISEALVDAGAAVVISYHNNGTGAEQLAARLRERSDKVLVHSCDVREDAQVQELFDTAIGKFGRVDILVNNSGITEPRSILDMTPEDWDRTLNINCAAPFSVRSVPRGR
ncbi:MAG TPA: SDR family NAD(P)-dependent oxidoreductase [Thermomicrobiales bacterium]|nr:SDR family NAD(P)-dependent oxidoreductase [Thermomicrobiales bacterium]